MIHGLSETSWWLYPAFLILFLLALFLLWKLLSVILPEFWKMINWFLPKLWHFTEDISPKLWKLIDRTVTGEKEVIRQEIHHHYGPQYQESHTTENVTDSVYIRKEPQMKKQRQRCGGCGGELEADWVVCPRCAKPLE